MGGTCLVIFFDALVFRNVLLVDAVRNVAKHSAASTVERIRCRSHGYLRRATAEEGAFRATFCNCASPATKKFRRIRGYWTHRRPD